MNIAVSRRLGFALVVIAFAAQAMAAVNSKDVVVEFSSDLPDFAQGHTEAMYLYDTGHTEAVLYLEQDHGRKLSILDVKPEPNYIHPASAQSDGPNTMLSISTNGPNLQTPEQQYQLVDVANASDPTLATIQGVTQRLDMPESGSSFRLNKDGVSVIRYLAREMAYQRYLYDEDDKWDGPGS